MPGAVGPETLFIHAIGVRKAVVARLVVAIVSLAVRGISFAVVSGPAAPPRLIDLPLDRAKRRLAKIAVVALPIVARTTAPTHLIFLAIPRTEPWLVVDVGLALVIRAFILASSALILTLILTVVGSSGAGPIRLTIEASIDRTQRGLEIGVAVELVEQADELLDVNTSGVR